MDLAKIVKYQKELGYVDSDIPKAEKTRTIILTAIAELIEVLNETDWKPQRPKTSFSKPYISEELVDVIFFIVELATIYDISISELSDTLDYKLVINYERLRKS